MNILVTGGAGYIGSHTCIELIEMGFNPIIIDNFSNSKKEVISRINKICNANLQVVESDLNNKKLLIKTIKEFKCHAVIHFAGLKAVGESQKNSLKYYENNVQGTINLLEAMNKCDLKRIVFSSSATVYGVPKFLPLTENHSLNPESVYGKTKLFVEEILRDLFISDPEWRISILRYFNPVGSHKSGLIGEDPKGIPNNLMPFLSQVAIGKRGYLNIWGDDYETKDGTGVRDYIHILDLAKGHIKAIQNLNNPQCTEYNLGTGKGYSVLEMVKTFEKVTGKKIDYFFRSRRPGDVAACFANANKALNDLKWKPEEDLFSMCEDTWRWQKQNPNGYS